MKIAHRLRKLERVVSLLQPAPEAPVGEPTEDERADDVGRLLWLQTLVSKEYGSRYPEAASRAPTFPTNERMHAWREAAELAWQQGHREYQSGLRPFAMAVWLEWKPRILKAERAHREWVRVHGPWVWDVRPRLDSLSMEEFKLLPVDQKVEVLLDWGEGHWAKEKMRHGRNR
jgi:hypothetical protein